jgi:hypothetical protein
MFVRRLGYKLKIDSKDIYIVIQIRKKKSYKEWRGIYVSSSLAVYVSASP